METLILKTIEESVAADGTECVAGGGAERVVGGGAERVAEKSGAASVAENIARAAEIIRNGGLVAFPTETVYGLGANALDPDAVKRIYEAKGRPSDNPTIVHIADAEGLADLTPVVSDDMKKLAEAFWPGPLTMVVKRNDFVPDVTTGGLETVGVRLPNEETARQLIRAAGTPVAAPSANISGRPSPTTAEHVIHDMDGKIDAILAGGACKHGIESTVIDMTEETPCILRPGVITPEMIAHVLKKEVALDPTLNMRRDAHIDADPSAHAGADALIDAHADGLAPKAPGMKYKHYAPKAKVTIFDGEGDAVQSAMQEEAERLKCDGKKVRVLEFESEEDAAKKFFSELRRADDDEVDEILLMAFDEEGLGFSVMNRMLKAASSNVKYVGGNMIIALAADHGGYELKNAIKEHLKARGTAPSPKLNAEGVTDGAPEKIKLVDLGTNSEESVDYPDYGKACAEAVASGKADLGIVCCGTGIGISIAANKVKGVRCALCTSVEMAELTKKHNNANMIALGGRTTSVELAIAIVDAWLDSAFEGGRHARRVAKLDEM